MSSLAPEAVELGKVTASNSLHTSHVTIASHFTHHNITTLFMCHVPLMSISEGREHECPHVLVLPEGGGLGLAKQITPIAHF